jgi:hypothetical protein
MANYVNSSIIFKQINEEAKSKLQEMFTRLRAENDQQWLSDIFTDGSELTYEQSESYEWNTTNIGPKWCYVEDYDIDLSTPYINLVSAWSPPSEGLISIIEILKEYDNNIVATITYEDEGPNFVGWGIYTTEDHMVYGDEMDDGELRELMFEENSDLREGWDEEKCDWKEDDDYTYSDKFNDSVWETIYNWQMTGIDDVLSYALNEKEVN